MKIKLLSEDLKNWRSERPDEWTMDRFIAHAKKLEDVADKARRYMSDHSCNDFTAYLEALDGCVINLKT